MRFATVFLAFALAGCAGAVQLGRPAPDPNPTIIGEGEVPSNEILIYRASEIGIAPNVATAPAILLDGRSIGTCRIGQPILIKVPEGIWTITALTPNGQFSQEVRVGEGDRANLRCGTTATPSLAPQPTLVRVDSTVALQQSGL